ncbi:peptidylarginine deiminase [Beggiatoa sp. PS]|nr:peptidylarginine deiminase [Beggiatoa sp. PS]
MKNTPVIDRFYMPAEWYPHSHCWMGWPCRAENWPFELARVQASYAKVIRAIARFESIKMIISPEFKKEAAQLCGENVEFISLPIDDNWLRDTGPTFVIDGQGGLAGIDWQFNAWGENRENLADYQQDVILAQHLLEYSQIPRYVAPFVLEGGAICVDGEGTLLTSEECLLNPNRNPNLTRSDIEKLLHDYLGISKVLWLGQGLQDDETAGHIDNLACFVRPGVVVALTCHDPQDNNYAPLQDNLHRLRCATDAKGRQLKIIEIEQPAYREDHNGLRLALSYMNFYIANGGIIMPTFSDPADKAAIATLTQTFPNHQIVPVDILDLIYGGGGIHCITQQQPIPDFQS